MQNWKLFTLILISIILMLLATGFLTKPAFGTFWTFDNTTALIGDTIGGITAPILGLLTIALIYLTFTDQRKFINEGKEADLFQSLMDYYREMKPLLINEEIENFTYKDQKEIWQNVHDNNNKLKPMMIKRIVIVSCNMLHFITDMVKSIDKIKDETYNNLLSSLIFRLYKNSVQYHINQLFEIETLIEEEKFIELNKYISILNKKWPNEKFSE